MPTEFGDRVARQLPEIAVGFRELAHTLRSPRTPTRPRRAAKVRSDQLVERAAATPQKRAGYAQAPELEGGCPLLEPDGVGPRAAALHVPDRDSQIWPVEPA